MRSSTNPRRVSYIWIACALLMVAIHLRLLPYAEDDAYIHLRIADHLAQFGVPYFNLGEPVLASSSTVWTLLLAAVFKFTSANMVVVAVLNGLFTVTAAQLFTNILVSLTGHSLKSAARVLFFILFLTLTFSASTAMMESSFSLLILGLGLQRLIARKADSFVFLSAAVFCRLEFAVFVVPLAIFALFRQRLPVSRVLLALVAGTVPFVAFDLFFFGTLIPNTVIAKAAVYRLTYQDALLTILRLTTPNSIVLSIFPYVVLFVVIIVTLCFVLACLRIVRIRTRLSDIDIITYLVMLGGLGIVGSYLVAKSLEFTWYVPLYAIPLLLACYQIILRSRQRGLYLLAVILTIPILVACVQMMWGGIVVPTQAPTFFAGARVRRYIQTGEDLYRAFPTARLLASEIGGLGEGFKGEILDGVGLVSPGALAFHPMAVPDERSSGMLGAIPVPYIIETHPELIVSHDTYAEAFLKSQARDKYWQIVEPVFLDEDMSAVTSSSPNSNNHLNIFIRKDALQPVARFGDVFELAAPTIEPTSLRTDGSLRITMYWHTLKAPELNYDVTVVYINGDGLALAQTVIPLLSDQHPTSAWRGDALYPVDMTTAIPATLNAGHYEVTMRIAPEPELQPLTINGQGAVSVTLGAIDIVG